MTQEVKIFDVWRKNTRYSNDQYLHNRLESDINEYLRMYPGHRIKSVNYIYDTHMEAHKESQRSALVVFDVVKELEL